MRSQWQGSTYTDTGIIQDAQTVLGHFITESERGTSGYFLIGKTEYNSQIFGQQGGFSSNPRIILPFNIPQHQCIHPEFGCLSEPINQCV